MELYKIVLPVVLLLLAVFAIRTQFDWSVARVKHPSDTSSLLPVTTPVTSNLCGPANENCKDLSTQIAAGLYQPGPGR